MSDLVTTRRQEHILVVTIDNPPVNALSPGVAEGLAAAVRAAQTAPSIMAIVVLGAGATFVAGAEDIHKSRVAALFEKKGVDLLIQNNGQISGGPRFQSTNAEIVGPFAV